MSYAVKEIFWSLQGEGAMTGQAMVFCRFSGCNLWSGREQDREAARCSFCDTDFVGTDGSLGGYYPDSDNLADALVDVIASKTLDPATSSRWVLFTGGEPLLQLDAPLIDACHARNLRIAVETNGTVLAPADIDWLCVSPKSKASLLQKSGNELKLVYPQPDIEPSTLLTLPFSHFSVQPCDGPLYQQNLQECIVYCESHPAWRLSLQTHKLLGIR